MHYRRALVPGGTYFFTAALEDRHSDLLLAHADLLRASFAQLRQRHPFEIVAIVILPEHLHAVWTLPQGDADYPLRWALIKAGFSREIPQGEYVRTSRTTKRERGIWQRRYWEHLVRDDLDLQRHVDYIHYNPVKHGYVRRASDWPHSSIHRHIRLGRVDEDWAAGGELEENFGERA